MAVTWSYEFVAAWSGAAMLCGMLICASARSEARRAPSEADVAHAVDCYRLWYGDEASQVIGEHMFAATFSRDGRYRRFLKDVAYRLCEAHGRDDEVNGADMGTLFEPDFGRLGRLVGDTEERPPEN